MLKALGSLFSTFFLINHFYAEIDSIMKVLEENLFFDSTKFEKIKQSRDWSSQVGLVGGNLVFLLLDLDDIMDENHNNLELQFFICV